MSPAGLEADLEKFNRNNCSTVVPTAASVHLNVTIIPAENQIVYYMEVY